MKRFIIEIDESQGADSNLENKVHIARSTYLSFIKLAKKIGAFNHLRQNIMLECDVCKSFIIGASFMHKVIEEVINATETGEYSDDGPDVDILYEIQGTLTTPLTDDEWIEHSTKGSKKFELVSDEGGELVTTTDGNPFRFVWEEVAFILDSTCSAILLLEASLGNN